MHLMSVLSSDVCPFKGLFRFFFDAVTVCRSMPHGIFCCKWLIVN